MKRLKHIILFTGALATGILLLTRCSDDKEKSGSPVDLQMAKLMGTWNATSAQMDDIDREGFQDFILALSPLPNQPKLSYIISGNPYASPWSAVTTGSLTFDEDQPEKYLVREDGVVIEYTVTDNELSMHFTFTESNSGGRVSGVGGDWVFHFEKE
jgi:hypothetical protein